MYKHEKRRLKAQLLKEQAVLKELEDEYEAALEQIEEKIAILQSDTLTQSRIYQLQYQQALKAQTEAILDKFHADEYTTIQQYLSDTYSDGFIGAVYGFHQQGVPLILPIDKKAAVKAILTDSKIKGSLYEALGIGVKEMKKSIRQEITRGIAAGLSYADMVRNLHNATTAPMANVRTIVRTEGHRIQQASQEDARQEAKAAGADVVKQWDATMDSSTRPTHQRLDGQIKEVDEPFELGSMKAMYPGDFGDPAEDCNCRCVALTRARWALDDDELERLKERAEYFGLNKTKSFADFKEKYLKASETLENSEKSGIIKEVKIFKSLGASARNYPVKLAGSRQHTKLAEDQQIKGKTFAGKGTNVEIRDRFRLESDYKIPAAEWEKVSGEGYIMLEGKKQKVELHWYEAKGEIYEMKVKRYLDES